MRKILMAVALWLLPVAGQACTLLQPFEMSQIGGAELVFVGKVTGYEDLGTPQGTALVTVTVEEALKGRIAGEVTLVWNSGMAMGPHPSRAKGRVLIGAMQGGRIAVSDMTPDERPDLPAIVQPYCGEVWMLPATRQSLRDAREALE